MQGVRVQTTGLEYQLPCKFTQFLSLNSILKMHQKCHFRTKELENFLGGGLFPSLNPTPFNTPNLMNMTRRRLVQPRCENPGNACGPDRHFLHITECRLCGLSVFTKAKLAGAGTLTLLPFKCYARRLFVFAFRDALGTQCTSVLRVYNVYLMKHPSLYGPTVYTGKE